MKKIQILHIAIFIFCMCSFCPAASAKKRPVPNASKQIVLVVTDSVRASSGTLVLYERKTARKAWKAVSEKIPVALGKNGLAWGIGLHDNTDGHMPGKREGDKKSPAGVFALGPAFGFASKDSMKSLKIPYMPIEAMMECVDDTASKYYNEIKLKDRTENPDWRTSEKMFRYGKWYDQCIVIDHNRNSREKGAGSCIFLHNQVDAGETTAGCIEAYPDKMKKIMFWLDASKIPVIVVFPVQLYNEYKKKWHLPEILK